MVVLGVGDLGASGVQTLCATTTAHVLAVDVREEAPTLADRYGAHFRTLLRPDTVTILQAQQVGTEGERFALSSAPEAIARLRSNRVRGRAVLVPTDPAETHTAASLPALLRD